MDKKVCKRRGQACSGQCKDSKTEQDGGLSGQCAGNKPLHIVTKQAQWFKPTSTTALFDLLDQHRSDNYRLVFGNTGFGQLLLLLCQKCGCLDVVLVMWDFYF